MTDFDFNAVHDEYIKDPAEAARLLSRARDVGVSYFVTPGCSLDTSQALLDLAMTDRHFVPTAGVHPYDVTKEAPSAEALQRLRAMLRHEKCCAVGECGLDYSNGFPEKDVQLKWFHAQLSLAVELGKPLFLHSRDAFADFQGALESHGFAPGLVPPVVGCVHCFTGTTEELQYYASCGLFIGLTGYVTTMDKGVLREWLDIITLSRLVIETDSPYMGWKGCRRTEAKGKDRKYPNVPASLVGVLDCIQDASPGWSREDIIQTTTTNALLRILNCGWLKDDF